MNQNERIKLFEETTALLTGHFILTSGLHAKNYVAKRRLYTRPLKVGALCLEIAEHFMDADVEAVASPAVGGVALSQWVAYHLTRLLGRDIIADFCEKVEVPGGTTKAFGFSEGCGEFLADKRVLVVDDVLTTGGSLDGARQAVVNAKGNVIGAGVLWLRTEGKTEMDIPFFPLITKAFPAWAPKDCQLCAENVPFTKLK